MRHWLLVAILISLAGAAFAEDIPATGAFNSAAQIALNGRTSSFSTAIATLEPRAGAPSYSWLRVHFYSFPPAPEDYALIAKGDVSSMDRKWETLADKDIDAYNTGNVVLQFSVDKDFKVWQVDMTVPGTGCTVASSEKEVKDFLQTYAFDGKHLMLKSKGTHTCPMTPPVKFDWDITLDAVVVQKAK